MGDGQTRDAVVCKEEDMKEGGRAWIAGGCVPLVHVSPISARTDGSRTGVVAGVARRAGGLVGQFELRTRKVEKSRKESQRRLQFPVIPVSRPVSSFHSPLLI